MPRKLMLNVETLAELTSDEMSAVVGGAESNSCTIANICIGGGGNPPATSTEHFRAFAAC